MPEFPKRWYILYPGLFFLLLLVLGLLAYDDYGISLDELWEMDTGLISLKYLVSRLRPALLTQFDWLRHYPNLETYIDADHGVTVTLPMVILKSVAGIRTWQGTFLFRHLLNFGIFYVGVFFFYRLVRLHFRHPAWALLGCLMLVLSPRIFADAFYNSKDLPFLSFCILGTYTLVQLLRRPRYGWALAHAFTCALAIDTRIMGVLLPALTLLFLALYAWQDRQYLRQGWKPLLVYPLLLVAFVILLWPYLWEDPLSRFISIWHNMRQFRWHETNLYFGRFIPAKDLPWHYIPVWVLITTPVAYTLCFLVGMGMLICHLVRRRQTDLSLYVYPVFLLAALAAVVVFNSVLYDGWRHLFFIYFAFLMVALAGVRLLWHLPHRNLGRGAVILGLGLTLVHTAGWMIHNHPYQNVYFSLISGKQAARLFERDYWGLSYRQGLAHILRHDASPVIRYHTPDRTARINAFIFPEKERLRLQWVPLAEASYLLTNYRWHPQPYPYPKEVYHIEVDGLKIMSVFKLP